jgi:protein SCO1/2
MSIVPERNAARNQILVALVPGVLAFVALAVVLLMRPGDPAPPPVVTTLPEFTLRTHRGDSFTRKDLDGTVWIADFFFTRCPGICPALTERMKSLQSRLPAGGAWGLVSFSVDPVHDTPDVLASYAAIHSANPDRWIFLTGERDSVYDLVENGFLLGVDEADSSAAEPILHSSKLVLIDAHAGVRGYYDAFEDEAIDRLFKDASRLIEDAGKPSRQR